MNGSKWGKLYVLASPIGNLKDITIRALEVMEEVDYLLAEDTREADKVLREYKIKKATIPYTDQKHNKLANKIENDLRIGKNIALISNSGTPLISDPGFRLVSVLKRKGFMVQALPGPNAAITALSISGLPTDNFVFLGFLPKGKLKRKKLLQKYGVLPASMVIYESSHRIKKLISEIHETLGDRYICLAKDMTKKFENILTDKVSVILNSEIKEKGEYVVVVAKEEFKYNAK